MKTFFNFLLVPKITKTKPVYIWSSFDKLRFLIYYNLFVKLKVRKIIKLTPFKNNTMKEIKSLMTFREIQEIGGFEELTRQGYSYYELYHRLEDGSFENHNLFEVYKK